MARFGKGVAAAAATVGLLAAHQEQGVIVDSLRPSTAQEQELGNLMLDAFGVQKNIRCVTEAELFDRRGPDLNKPKHIFGFSPEVLPIIWFRQDVCDGVQQFASREADRLIELTPKEMFSLGVFAHEGRHALGTEGESRAECEAAQVVYKIPLALGASAITAEQVGTATAGDMLQLRQNDQKYSLEDCREGSPHDLGLKPPIFPVG